MNELFVSFKVARAAREDGYTDLCMAKYNVASKRLIVRKSMDYGSNNATYGMHSISAPTITKFKRWIEKKYKVCIYALPIMNLDESIKYIPYIIRKDGQEEIEGHFNTEKEAVEEAILYTLQKTTIGELICC